VCTTCSKPCGNIFSGGVSSRQDAMCIINRPIICLKNNELLKYSEISGLIEGTSG
jgi:hypothetical protein